MGDFAILGRELANELVNRGFELIATKRGSYTTVYYFNDSEALRAALCELVK